MMADAGLNAYRFSIEWARVEPEQGKFNENEIFHSFHYIFLSKGFLKVH